MTPLAIVAMHFGHLPLWEQIAVIAIAVVPFVVLGVVMVVVQRRDADDGPMDAEKDAGHHT